MTSKSVGSSNRGGKCHIHGYQSYALTISDDTPGGQYVCHCYCRLCAIEAIEKNVPVLPPMNRKEREENL